MPILARPVCRDKLHERWGRNNRTYATAGSLLAISKIDRPMLSNDPNRPIAAAACPLGGRIRAVGLALWVVSWLLSLGGCGYLAQWKTNGHKVGPDHVAPTAAVAEHWIDFNNPKLISSQNGVDDENWWRLFGDPEIEKIVSAAQTNYLPLRIAMLRIQEARLQRAIAVGNLLPQSQEFFAEFQRIQNSDNGNQIGIADLGNTFDLYQFGFNANWELDVWGRLRRQIESEGAKVQGTIEDRRDVKLSLVSDAIAAYIEIRTNQDRLVFAHANIKAQQKTLELAESRFKNGSVSKLDVTQARANLEATRAAIPELERSLRVANNRLCVLLGLSPRDLIAQMGWAGVPTTPDAILVGMPVDLLRRRPDIRSAERAIASQSALIGVAAADLFPTFSLRGTINWQSFNFPDLFESAANAGAIIPGVRWNLLNYGRLMNNVQIQETRLERTIVEYRQAVLKAGSEVEDAMVRFVKAREQIASRERAVAATAESIEIATLQYEEGTVEFDRVNELRKDLVRQQDLLALARGEAALGIIAIYRTLGGGWSAADQAISNCAPAPIIQAEPAPPMQSIPSQESKPPLTASRSPQVIVRTIGTQTPLSKSPYQPIEASQPTSLGVPKSRRQVDRSAPPVSHR
ncbi:Cation efflux system protein CusC precursor [Rosistilla carotiformis]|uniref:Cation efflux system protein CusC n=2 Tax=Rosistilla carotiformis TaxID=2528017 RepID=A0A518K0G9_9BACT|nr:Cation efflux system protein CusC precursor [Rosistilla carotiformis]